jgi:uncharacterized protein (DUF736 family)
MSKKVGTLHETTSRETGEIGYLGTVDIAGIKGRIALRPSESKRSANSPDYRVLIDAGRGWSDFGAVWEKEPAGGGNTFLSITIDNETLPRPIYVAAFPPSEDGDDGWSIVWGRPRGGGVRQSAEQGGGISDEIPF